jgi:hypothetical protein
LWAEALSKQLNEIEMQRPRDGRCAALFGALTLELQGIWRKSGLRYHVGIATVSRRWMSGKLVSKCPELVRALGLVTAAIGNSQVNP